MGKSIRVKLFLIALVLFVSLSFGQVKILAYNVFLRPDPVGWWDYKAERFSELVEAVRPYDIIGLSEVFDDDLRNKWKEHFHSTHPYQIEPPQSKNSYLVNGGITFFSRYPITFQQKTIYKDGNGWDAFAEKGVIFARVKMPDGKEWEFALTHVQADSNQFVVRQKQFDQMHKFIKKHQQTSTLFLLGDFNVDEKDSQQYQDMLQRFSRPLDTYRSLKKDPGFTMDGKENPLVGGDYLERLDYILLSDPQRKVAIRDCKVVKFPMSAPVKKAKFMSDHYGVEATINTDTRELRSQLVDLRIILHPQVPRQKPVSLVVREANGQQRLLEISTIPNNQILFSQLQPGRTVIRLTIDGHILHKIIDLTDSRTLQMDLPLGIGKAQYICSSLWPRQPMSISLSGKCFIEKKIQPGNTVYFSNVPQGLYRATLNIHHQAFVKDIKIGNLPVNLNSIFDVNLEVVKGELKHRFSQKPRVLFIPIEKQVKYYRAFVRSNRYQILIPKGQYQVAIYDGNQLVNITVQNIGISSRVAKNSFTIYAANDKPAILLITKDKQPAKVLSRWQLLSSNFSWFPITDKITLDSYPDGQYKFFLYTLESEKWQQALYSSVKAQGGDYTLVFK